MKENAHRNPNLTFNSVFTRLLEQGEKYLIRNMDTERFEKLMTYDKEHKQTRQYNDGGNRC